MLLFEESSEESDEHDEKKIKLMSNSRIEHLFIVKKLKLYTNLLYVLYLKNTQNFVLVKKPSRINEMVSKKLNYKKLLTTF